MYSRDNPLAQAMAKYVTDEIERRDMTQSELSRAIGWSVSTVNNALNNRAGTSVLIWNDMFQFLDIEVGFRTRPQRKP